MAINLNLKLEKKHLYLLSAIMIFLVGVGVVIAYNTGPPNVHGHDAVEIANLPSGTGGGVSLGDWVDKSPATGGRVGQVYGPAATDGLVIANSKTCTDCGERYEIAGYTDGNNPPTTLRALASGGDYEPVGTITMPVKKGHYWKVDEAKIIWWIPLEGGASSPAITRFVNPSGNLGIYDLCVLQSFGETESTDMDWCLVTLDETSGTWSVTRRTANCIVVCLDY